MEVITMDSQAYRELTAKINAVAKFVAAIESKKDGQSDDGWVDSYEVCTFIKISEIERLMQANIIRRSDEHLQDLIQNYKLHVEQRRNIKADK